MSKIPKALFFTFVTFFFCLGFDAYTDEHFEDTHGHTTGPEVSVFPPSPKVPEWAPEPVPELGPDEALITIVGTNDIHGGLLPSIDKESKTEVGGIAFFTIAVEAIRKGTDEKYNKKAVRAGVVVVDAGDQFQGTLLSNNDEGQLTFKLMRAIGYDLVVPGNHDYDFGPIDPPKGPPVDQDKDPKKWREALERLVAQNANSEGGFPLVSANTFLLNSIRDKDNQVIPAKNVGCAPLKEQTIDWSRAKHPKHLSKEDYVIKDVAGVKVALIGLDHVKTYEVTTSSNVKDLCFADEYETYLRVREKLVKGKKADVFVIVIHDGDASNDQEMKAIVTKLTADPKNPLVDAVVSGHTHFAWNLKMPGNVPLIQSGYNMLRLGKIDLVYDRKNHRIVREKNRSAGGARLYHEFCAPEAKGFCTADREKKTVSYLGVPVTPDLIAEHLIDERVQVVSKIESEVLGEAKHEVDKDRIKESPLANALTDDLKAASKAEITILNTGGIRTGVSAGNITYGKLFSIFPFNNKAYVLKLSASNVVGLVKKSIITCGKFGSIMQSGLHVEFSRNCPVEKPEDRNEPGAGLDLKAELRKVIALKKANNGRDDLVLFDAAQKIEPPKDVTFKVATIDFLMNGGEGGFDEILGKAPVLENGDLGILRELLVAHYRKNPAAWDNEIDHRWVNVNPE